MLAKLSNKQAYLTHHILNHNLLISNSFLIKFIKLKYYYDLLKVNIDSYT